MNTPTPARRLVCSFCGATFREGIEPAQRKGSCPACFAQQVAAAPPDVAAVMLEIAALLDELHDPGKPRGQSYVDAAKRFTGLS